ncbi:adenylate kinase isoenzyme 1-like isoform X2 [Plodia interpunctella]|uniref:adenylate kinase isoenzyme 1-like isoform X2 n=1 Tax=Plodia interpunctella TaxID=58824 RepID=UPI002368B3AE|nr:adenylate kinase isoenzyme 1-like isoform X2 [Plodia interpunctella]
MGCVFTRNEDEEASYDMAPIRHLPVIFVNGVPGAGNQTVAQTISNITGYTMIRPGDLVRAEATKDTTRGRLIADKLSAQEELPEQLTVDLIKETMLAHQDATGFILVGFPKNPRMSNIFNRQVKWPEKIVALEVDNEVAATRLQNKLSELGRPESEINAARDIIREAAHKVKNVHKRFGGHVVTLDSSGNPKALASTLKEILSDTIEKSNKMAEKKPPTAISAPNMNVKPLPAPTECPVCPVAVAPSSGAPTADSGGEVV